MTDSRKSFFPSFSLCWLEVHEFVVRNKKPCSVSVWRFGNMDAVTLQLFSGGQETCLASPGFLLRSLSVLTLVFTNRAAVRNRARPQDCVHLQELLFLGSILDLQVFLSLCPWFLLHGSSTKEGPFLCDQNFSVTTQRLLGLISGSFPWSAPMCVWLHRDPLRPRQQPVNLQA